MSKLVVIFKAFETLSRESYKLNGDLQLRSSTFELALRSPSICLKQKSPNEGRWSPQTYNIAPPLRHIRGLYHILLGSSPQGSSGLKKCPLMVSDIELSIILSSLVQI